MSSVLGPGRVRTEVLGPDGNPVTGGNPLPVRAETLVIKEAFDGNSNTEKVFGSPMRGVVVSNDGNADLVLRVGGPSGLIMLPGQEGWETGNISAGNGSPMSSQTKIRTVDFVSIPGGAENLIGVVNPGCLINIYQYDDEDNIVNGSPDYQPPGTVWEVHTGVTKIKIGLSYDPPLTTNMSPSDLAAVSPLVGTGEPPGITIKAGEVFRAEFKEFTLLGVESTVEFRGYVLGEHHVD